LKDFRKQKVWQKAHDLALEVYRITQAFPKTELFGLTSQSRRAGVSIPANIAEGCGRDTDADFARFLQIAMGSASELRPLRKSHVGQPPSAVHTSYSRRRGRLRYMLTTNGSH
jgi:hypothetical protein